MSPRLEDTLHPEDQDRVLLLSNTEASPQRALLPMTLPQLRQRVQQVLRQG